jgi:hypothetical protein
MDGARHGRRYDRAQARRQRIVVDHPARRPDRGSYATDRRWRPNWCLYQVHILPLSQSPPPPVPLPEPPSQYKGIGQKVDGVEVKILRVQRISERDATLLQLDYSVTTGSELRWHDPDHFAQLILEGAAVAPVWTSTWAGDLPLNSVKEFSVKFRAPPGAAQSVVFRFGEEHHIDLLATVLDRN